MHSNSSTISPPPSISRAQGCVAGRAAKTRREEAEYYTQALGLSVLLLAPASKAPIGGTDSHGVHSATSRFEDLLPDLEKFPQVNIAIAPAASGLITADNDRRNGGDTILGHLVDELGPAPFQTAQVRKSGGGHYHWRAPSGISSLDLSDFPDLGLAASKGFELFGPPPFKSKQYVLVPGSLHPDGYPYEWRKGYTPEEVGFAPFPMELLAALREHLQKTFPIVESRVSRAACEADAERASTLREYDSDERFAKAVCSLMGIPFKVKKAFSSPLREDQHPSAAIYLTREGGEYRFTDFSLSSPNGNTAMYTLAQLYGAWATGKAVPLPSLSRVQFALWQVRLLMELGWTEPAVPISVEMLPKQAPRAAAAAWEGFRLLLQVKSVHYGGLVPAAYTYEFCSQWTGLPLNAAVAGIMWLRRNRFLVPAGQVKSGKGRAMLLYLPVGAER